MDTVYKLPRLYVETLSAGGAALSDPQWHYLKNVLRTKAGDGVRLFNETVGEYRATITTDGKRPELKLDELLRPATLPAQSIHLYVPPLAKDRFDFLIEKATELGITDYHPLLSERAGIRAVNQGRLRAQAIEAAEQCERMTIPRIHAPVSLPSAIAGAKGTLYGAVERLNASSSSTSETQSNDVGNDEVGVHIFIGPPGGWTDGERDLLLSKTVPLDLGETVLRAETAALVALARLT